MKSTQSVISVLFFTTAIALAGGRHAPSTNPPHRTSEGPSSLGEVTLDLPSSLHGGSCHIEHIVKSTKGDIVASFSNGLIARFDSTTGKLLQQIEGSVVDQPEGKETLSVESVVSPNGRFVAVGGGFTSHTPGSAGPAGKKDPFLVWDLDSAKPRVRLSDQLIGLSGSSFDPSGNFFASVHSGVTIYDLRSDPPKFVDSSRDRVLLVADDHMVLGDHKKLARLDFSGKQTPMAFGKPDEFEFLKYLPESKTYVFKSRSSRGYQEPPIPPPGILFLKADGSHSGEPFLLADAVPVTDADGDKKLSWLEDISDNFLIGGNRSLGIEGGLSTIYDRRTGIPIRSFEKSNLKTIPGSPYQLLSVPSLSDGQFFSKDEPCPTVKLFDLTLRPISVEEAKEELSSPDPLKSFRARVALQNHRDAIKESLQAFSRGFLRDLPPTEEIKKYIVGLASGKFQVREKMTEDLMNIVRFQKSPEEFFTELRKLQGSDKEVIDRINKIEMVIQNEPRRFYSLAANLAVLARENPSPEATAFFKSPLGELAAKIPCFGSRPRDLSR